MTSTAVRPRAALDIWESIPIGGRYRLDILNDFLVRFTRPEIEDALKWLCERDHLRMVGNMAGVFYSPPERKVRYDSIRPMFGEQVLMQMHANFIGEAS